MKDINMVKKDLGDIQKNFNPEKSTYKVFGELIKHNYTPEEMLKVLSKIRGVHKYPDSIKAEFLDIINSLNILKEQEEREKLRQKQEEEKQKQEAKTRELKDIINNLEKGKEKQELEKLRTNNVEIPKDNLEKVEVLEEAKENPLKELEDLKIKEDDGRLMYIILILLVIISLVVVGLLILLY